MDDEIFSIRKDKERARDLYYMAKDRLEIIKLLPREKAYKLIEEYYEIMKELLTAIMYTDGFKTLSHVKLIEYFSENYKCLQDNEVQLIDTMRKYRNGIVYYGKKVSYDFLINYENKIIKIITILLELIEKKLNDG